MISSRQWPATKGIEQNLAILDCYARRPFISAQIFLWADRWAFWIRYSSVVTWLLLLCGHFLSGCAVHCLGRAEQLRLCCRLQTSSYIAFQAVSESMNCIQSSLLKESAGPIENNENWVLLRGAHLHSHLVMQCDKNSEFWTALLLLYGHPVMKKDMKFELNLTRTFCHFVTQGLCTVPMQIESPPLLFQQRI